MTGQIKLKEQRVAEYGEVFTAERTTRIGVIPIGYADGLNRHLSERGFKVWLNGSMVPIVGSICMDMCMLDLGDLEARVGDRVVVFGEENPVETRPYRKESRGCIIMRVRCGET